MKEIEEPEKTKKIMIWRCGNCKEVHVSRNFTRHDLNECPCGESYVDMEHLYSRYGGDIDKKIVINLDDFIGSVYDE